MRLDANGAQLWATPTSLKTSPTRSSRLTGATSTLGYAAYAWSDAPDSGTESNNIHAQNLPYSGVFNDAIFGDRFE